MRKHVEEKKKKTPKVWLDHHSIKRLWDYISRNTVGLNWRIWEWDKNEGSLSDFLDSVGLDHRAIQMWMCDITLQNKGRKDPKGVLEIIRAASSVLKVGSIISVSRGSWCQSGCQSLLGTMQSHRDMIPFLQSYRGPTTYYLSLSRKWDCHPSRPRRQSMKPKKIILEL